jgi:hypothetical protein
METKSKIYHVMTICNVVIALALLWFGWRQAKQEHFSMCYLFSCSSTRHCVCLQRSITRLRVRYNIASGITFFFRVPEIHAAKHQRLALLDHCPNGFGRFASFPRSSRLKNMGEYA